MLAKRNTYIGFIIILALTALSLSFVFPQYVNKAIDFLKPKIEGVPILRYLPRLPERPFKLGLDLQGGSHLVYQADLAGIQEPEKKDSMAGLRDVIERRVNIFGVSEPVVAVQEAGGNFRLTVDLPGVANTDEAIKMIGKTPYLEFKEEREEAERNEILQKNQEIEGETKEDAYFKPTQLTGRYLEKSTLGFEPNIYEPNVLLEFNQEGTEIFKELTSRNVNKRLAIYIDNVLISAPVVREVISQGKAQISGDFTVEEAKELARNLSAGALPVPIQLISQSTIGPSLGTISLDKSLKAGIYGFAAICLFLIIFYRLPGLFSSMALVIYILLILASFKLFGVTITLAGVAGFLLSMGMAVDANILIFARMREELKAGREYSAAISEGTRRAWPSIRDGNFTTILVAAILFSLGSSFVKGFALTMIIGNLIGMFSAIVITNNFLRLFPVKKISWLWR